MTDQTLIRTSDLCDQYPEQVKLLPWPVRAFGGREAMHGQIVTLRVQGCNQAIIDAFSLAGDNRILVVENIGPEPYAVTGDRLAKLACDQGWQGLVLLGNVRDSATLKTIDLGVWALGTHPMRGKSGRPATKDVLLSFSGFAVHSGDWLYADNDGVVISADALHL